MTADNERQAEIEAAARAMREAVLDGPSTDWSVLAVAAIAALDRARDARHGTTTAEDDTAKLVEALRRIADPHAPLSPSRAQIAYEALAEFAPGDTPHPTDTAPVSEQNADGG